MGAPCGSFRVPARMTPLDASRAPGSRSWETRTSSCLTAAPPHLLFDSRPRAQAHTPATWTSALDAHPLRSMGPAWLASPTVPSWNRLRSWCESGTVRGASQSPETRSERSLQMSRRKRFTRNLGRKLKSPLPVRTTVEWIRFEHENEPYGVFSYLSDARERLPAETRRELEHLRDWFADHLHVPDPLTIERFWFRSEATEYVTQARRLATILCAAGIPIIERRTRRVPGKVNWEDHNQVAVRTYRDTPQPRRTGSRRRS